ncbi:MAG: glycosyltransferase, partial [Candidatus Omnitrophota bacterium]
MKVRILFITDNFLPHWGGSRVYYHNICKNLPRGSVTVLTGLGKGGAEFDKKQDYSIYRIPVGKIFPEGSQMRDLCTCIALIFHGVILCLKVRPDVMHCGEILPTGLAGLVLNRLFRIPFIIHTHGEDVGFLEKLR